jgi:RNA polymerase sigma-70 factor (ECF subfamily)
MLKNLIEEDKVIRNVQQDRSLEGCYPTLATVGINGTQLPGKGTEMTDRELDFKRIHDTYWGRIHLYLARIVGDGEAEDLTQEVFTRVSKSLKTFRGESQLSTWIFQIANNAARDRIRQRARTGEELPMDMVGEREDKNLWTGEMRTLDQQVIHREMNDCIRNVVSKLPDIYRPVVVLSDLEGFKNEEIAEILGLGLETVKIRLHRGRSKLKELLSRHCILYHDDRNELACDVKEGSKIISNHPKRQKPS